MRRELDGCIYSISIPTFSYRCCCSFLFSLIYLLTGTDWIAHLHRMKEIAPGNKDQGCTTDEKAMENAQQRQSKGKHWCLGLWFIKTCSEGSVEFPGHPSSGYPPTSCWRGRSQLCVWLWGKCKLTPTSVNRQNWCNTSVMRVLLC